MKSRWAFWMLSLAMLCSSSGVGAAVVLRQPRLPAGILSRRRDDHASMDTGPALALAVHRRPDLGVPKQRHLGQPGLPGRLRLPGCRRAAAGTTRRQSRHLRKPQLPAANLSHRAANSQRLGDRSALERALHPGPYVGFPERTKSGSATVAPPISACSGVADLRRLWHHRQSPAGMVCESRNYQQQYCATGRPIMRAWLVTQRSHAACVQGRSWGYDNSASGSRKAARENSRSSSADTPARCLAGRRSALSRRQSREFVGKACAISTPSRAAAAASASRRAPGRRTPGSSSMAATSVSTRSTIDAAAGQRVRVDHQECLPEPRPVALVDEERVGLESERGAGERAREQLDHQRQHRALGAAHRQHRARRAPPFASVVGRPSRSSAQPSGIGSPFLAATITLPRATSDSDRSMVNGARHAARKHRGDRDWCRTTAAGRPRRAWPPANCRTPGPPFPRRRPAAGDTRPRRSDGCW